MKNWKTTLFGLLAAVCIALAGNFTGLHDVFTDAGALFLAIAACFQKDNNVTGGNVSNGLKLPNS
jgi:hypothetical protein